jgi:hypothetical protein
MQIVPIAKKSHNQPKKIQGASCRHCVAFIAPNNNMSAYNTVTNMATKVNCNVFTDISADDKLSHPKLNPWFVFVYMHFKTILLPFFFFFIVFFFFFFFFFAFFFFIVFFFFLICLCLLVLLGIRWLFLLIVQEEALEQGGQQGQVGTVIVEQIQDGRNGNRCFLFQRSTSLG